MMSAFTPRNLSKRSVVCYLLGILALLIWRYAFTRDVLVINHYTQPISVRIAGFPCCRTVPARGHCFSELPYILPYETAVVTVFRADGKLLKSQTATLTAEKSHYSGLVILDIKP